MNQMSVVNPIKLDSQNVTPKYHAWVWLILLVMVGAVYSGALEAGFYFDDEKSILLDSRMVDLGQAAQSAFRSDRGLVTLSLAVNFALGDENPWGYHFFNVMVHWLNGLLLYGLVRQTLLLERIGFSPHRATAFALASAMLWLIHPLGSQAVVYVIQRAELMASGMYLASAYTLARSVHSQAHRKGWLILCVGCCLVGMQCKLIAFTIPIALLAYDRLFIASSYRKIWQNRRWLYVGLFATWGMVLLSGILSLLFVEVDKASAGANMSRIITPATYLATQSGVIIYYLKLCFWPSTLIFDHAWPAPAQASEYAVPFFILTGVFLLLIGLYIRGVRWSWLGVCFFLILAPTSSIVPVADLAVEHRMYLPLACVCVGMILLVGHLLASYRVVAIGVLSLVLVVLGVRTLVRVEDYHDGVSLWRSVLKEVPHSSRAEIQLKTSIAMKQGLGKQMTLLRQAIRENPQSAEACFQLGEIYLNIQFFDVAESMIEKACILKPHKTQWLLSLGRVKRLQGHLVLAISIYQKYLEKNPNHVIAISALAELYAAQKQWDQALLLLNRAIELQPDNPNLLFNRVNILLRAGRPEEALGSAKLAYEKTAQAGPAIGTLASAYAANQMWSEAIVLFKKLLAKSPNDLSTIQRLAWIYATCPEEKFRDAQLALQYARIYFDQAGRISPVSWDTLAAAYAQAGEYEKAVDAISQGINRLEHLGRTDLISAYQKRLDLYKQKKSYHPRKSMPADTSDGR